MVDLSIVMLVYQRVFHVFVAFFFDISFFLEGILGIVDDVLVVIFRYIFGYLMICLRILWIYGILLDSSRFFFCEVVDAIHSWTTTP